MMEVNTLRSNSLDASVMSSNMFPRSFGFPSGISNNLEHQRDDIDLHWNLTQEQDDEFKQDVSISICL